MIGQVVLGGVQPRFSFQVLSRLKKNRDAGFTLQSGLVTGVSAPYTPHK